jgi:putative endonuclease
VESSSGKLNLPPGTGRAGEAVVRSYVVEILGYEITDTNFRNREGEINIVDRDDGMIIFIEVKTRTNQKFGAAIEQISSSKAQRLQATAQRYLSQNDLENAECRIDLLSIEMDRRGRVSNVEHVQYAIEDQE